MQVTDVEERTECLASMMGLGKYVQTHAFTCSVARCGKNQGDNPFPGAWKGQENLSGHPRPLLRLTPVLYMHTRM